MNNVHFNLNYDKKLACLIIQNEKEQHITILQDLRRTRVSKFGKLKKYKTSNESSR